MALAQAKCTNCGGTLQVDNEKEAAVCQHCGAAFVVEKAINTYNIANAQINAQTVNIQTVNNAQQLRINAEKSFAAGQFKNAYLDFKKAIELDRTDYEAYWGIIRIHMAVFPNYPLSYNDIDFCEGLKMYGNSSDYRIRADLSEHSVRIAKYYSFWITEGDPNNSYIPQHIYIDNAVESLLSYAPKDVVNVYQDIMNGHNRRLKQSR